MPALSAETPIGGWNQLNPIKLYTKSQDRWTRTSRESAVFLTSDTLTRSARSEGIPSQRQIYTNVLRSNIFT